MAKPLHANKSKNTDLVLKKNHVTYWQLPPDTRSILGESVLMTRTNFKCCHGDLMV